MRAPEPTVGTFVRAVVVLCIGWGTPTLVMAQAQAPATCTTANLLRSAELTASGTTGLRTRPADGVLAVEGTLWNAPDATVLSNEKSSLVFDLRGATELRALLLQGDNNDLYVVETSLDQLAWSPLWTAPVTEVGQGLRTRVILLPKAVTARYLRVMGRGGDTFYSVAEVQAFCKVPAVFPPPLRIPPRKWGWDAIDNEVMVQVKGVLAAAAAVVLLLGSFVRLRELRVRSRVARVTLVLVPLTLSAATAWLGYLAQKGQGPQALVKFARTGGSMPGWYYSAAMLLGATLVLLALSLRRGGPRIFDASLAVLGLASFFAFWNLGHYHFDHYIHIWEHYHYIVGAKYGPELRYARLYDCTAVADVQDGLRARVKARKVRQIGTNNELGTTAGILTNPALCTSHFKDPARWEQFRKDVRFFRGRFSRDRWDQSQQDHGYNGTPVWAITARLIADRVELTWENIVKLGIIDSAFLVVMWLAVLWAFGWRAAAVALVYWGTNFPARFYWNGGSYLRYDWQLWLVLGLCLLRRQRHFLGGAALTYATLLRVFPGFVVATLVLKVLAGWVRERRIFLTRAQVWFAAGCIGALVVLVPASDWAMNGLDAWPEFAVNSKKHLATALTNNMGLKTVMGYELKTRAIQMRNDKLEDPFKEWKDAKHHFYGARAPFYYLFIILFCVMLARAADREGDEWAAACLGAGLIAIAAELTCYYYGFLLAYGLLWDRRKLPGLLAAALAATTCYMYRAISWNDDHFAAMSLATVIAVVIVTAHAAFGRRAATTPGG